MLPMREPRSWAVIEDAIIGFAPFNGFCRFQQKSKISRTLLRLQKRNGDPNTQTQMGGIE